MLWTREDELAVASCWECVRTCKRYYTKPAPWFLTLIKAYEALKEAGLIEQAGERPKDLCLGCVDEVNGGCRNGFQAATLSLNGREVVKCGLRRERKGET